MLVRPFHSFFGSRLMTRRAGAALLSTSSVPPYQLNPVKQRKADRLSRLGTETAYAVALAAAEIQAKGRKVYPFHIGDLNFKTPQCVINATQKAMNEGKTGYCPAAGIKPLREALAKTVGEERGVEYTFENVSVQPGGKSVITKFFQCIMNEGDEVLYPSPGYPIYESQIRYFGGVCKPYTYLEGSDGFRLDLEALKKQITPKTVAIVYNNYQNPMGIASSDEEMMEIAKFCNEHDLMVLSDEPYFKIIFDGLPSKSIVSLPGMVDRTCILYTYSKSFAMTGWRLGAAIGPKWLVEAITKINTNDEACTTHFVQYGGIEALTNPEAAKFTKDMVAELQERRDALIPMINSIPGFKCHNPTSTFYLIVNVTEAMNRLRLSSHEEFRTVILDKTGVSFCTREHFGECLPGENNKYVRFAYSGITTAEIKEAGEKLKTFMDAVYQGKPYWWL